MRNTVGTPKSDFENGRVCLKIAPHSIIIMFCAEHVLLVFRPN